MSDSDSVNPQADIDLDGDTVYDAVVNSVKDYGVFVDLKKHPDLGGLAHRSMLPENRHPDDYMNGDSVKVRFVEEKDEGDLAFKVVSDSFVGYGAEITRILSSESEIDSHQDSVGWDKNDDTPIPLEITNPGLDALKVIQQAMENGGEVTEYSKETEGNELTIEISIDTDYREHRV